MTDWSRKESWSPSDERDFRTRLARSRKRDEYLRVQAITLIEHGHPEPAIQLLDELLEKRPPDIWLAIVHEFRARALVDCGHPDEALMALTKALDAQRTVRGVQGYSALSFAELVLSLKRVELFQQALANLDELHAENPFPATQYREATARALLHEALGDPIAAKRFAAVALQAAATTRAPFARHPGVGLVKGVDPLVHAKLRRLSTSRELRE